MPACALYFEDHDAAEADAAVVVEVDAQLDVIDAGIAVDAEVDALIATHPPFPMPSPCDTCVGFSCEAACADAGVDAP